MPVTLSNVLLKQQDYKKTPEKKITPVFLCSANVCVFALLKFRQSVCRKCHHLPRAAGQYVQGESRHFIGPKGWEDDPFCSQPLFLLLSVSSETQTEGCGSTGGLQMPLGAGRHCPTLHGGTSLNQTSLDLNEINISGASCQWKWSYNHQNIHRKKQKRCRSALWIMLHLTCQ